MPQGRLTNYKLTSVDKLQAAFLNDLLILEKSTSTIYNKVPSVIAREASEGLQKYQQAVEKKLDEEQRKIQQNYIEFLQSAKPAPEKTSHKDKTKEFIKSLETLDLSTAEFSDEESKSDKEETETKLSPSPRP